MTVRHFNTLPKICCIYFLFIRGKLIYIGQTTDLRSRMSGHHFNYIYDSIRYIRCVPTKLKEYEKRLIKILKPLANWEHNFTNPNRIKRLPYRAPKWASHYDRMLIFSEAKKTGNHPWKDGLQWHLNHEKEKFKYYYKAHGFKGTFLDPTMVHPI